MKKAIIIHGMPSKESYYIADADAQSNCHWLPWIQQQLIVKDILAQTPEMPFPFEPKYEEWLGIFEQFKIDEDTILIGHSCGGGFLVRWLSENNIKVGKVVLVAPWIDTFKTLKTGFFNFIIDKNIVQKTNGIIIFSSDNDDEEILDSVRLLEKEIIDIKHRILKGKGHFVFRHMGTKEFPELFEEVIGE